MRISDWSSDVCSSDLTPPPAHQERSPAMNTAVSHETERLHPAADTILRLLGVALQIASTLALARTLAIGDTGLFFQGLVVTIAGATNPWKNRDRKSTRLNSSHSGASRTHPAS